MTRFNANEGCLSYLWRMVHPWGGPDSIEERERPWGRDEATGSEVSPRKSVIRSSAKIRPSGPDIAGLHSGASATGSQSRRWGHVVRWWSTARRNEVRPLCQRVCTHLDLVWFSSGSANTISSTPYAGGGLVFAIRPFAVGPWRPLGARPGASLSPDRSSAPDEGRTRALAPKRHEPCHRRGAVAGSRPKARSVIDPEIRFWSLVILAFIVIGLLLDYFLGSY